MRRWRLPGCPGVWALGDVALLAGEDGRPLPGLDQVAKQQGIHLSRLLAAHPKWQQNRVSLFGKAGRCRL